MKIVFLTAWVGSIGLAMVWFASLLAGYLDVASRVLWEESCALRVCQRLPSPKAPLSCTLLTV